MTSPDPGRELHSTYFVEDRDNQEEMKRVRLQDHMLTTGMGGPLPEQADPSTFRYVLDVGFPLFAGIHPSYALSTHVLYHIVDIDSV